MQALLPITVEDVVGDGVGGDIGIRDGVGMGMGDGDADALEGGLLWLRGRQRTVVVATPTPSRAAWPLHELAALLTHQGSFTVSICVAVPLSQGEWKVPVGRGQVQ